VSSTVPAHQLACELHSRTPAEEPLSPSKSQLKKENQSLERELAAAKEALRAREPSGRKRGREEESPAMSSAEKSCGHVSVRSHPLS
jgi:hypothetical protein